MKRFSLLQAMFLSFFSKSLYQDVRRSWKGTGFLYLLVLLALTWIPVMIKFHLDISGMITRESPKYINQIPKITITRGEVSVDKPVPYTITDPDSGVPLMIIDTSGRFTSLDQTPAVSLLTKTRFMFRQQHRSETRIYDLSEIESLTVDRERVNLWTQAFKHWFAPLAYPFALAGSFAYRILQVLLYAAIGMLFVSMLKASLDYMEVVRLASVSITPAVILKTLRVVSGTTIPYAWLLGLLVAMGYLFFAVKANSGKESEAAVERR